MVVMATPFFGASECHGERSGTESRAGARRAFIYHPAALQSRRFHNLFALWGPSIFYITGNKVYQVGRRPAPVGKKVKGTGMRGREARLDHR